MSKTRVHMTISGTYIPINCRVKYSVGSSHNYCNKNYALICDSLQSAYKPYAKMLIDIACSIDIHREFLSTCRGTWKQQFASTQN